MKHNELKQLEEELRVADLILHETAHNLVFGKGNENAKIFLIGEAPGRDEDLSGIPFVGRAGQKLDILLKQAGIEQRKVYVTNIVKYRPPNNRNPSKAEIIQHAPYLVKQISLISPNVLVTLGNFSSKFILSSCQISNMHSVKSITHTRGFFRSIIIEGKEMKVMPTYHPAATLYNPNLEQYVLEDLRKVQRESLKKNL